MPLLAEHPTDCCYNSLAPCLLFRLHPVTSPLLPHFSCVCARARVSPLSPSAVRTDEKLAKAPEPVKERRAQKEISLVDGANINGQVWTIFLHCPYCGRNKSGRVFDLKNTLRLHIFRNHNPRTAISGYLKSSKWKNRWTRVF